MFAADDHMAMGVLRAFTRTAVELLLAVLRYRPGQTVEIRTVQ